MDCKCTWPVLVGYISEYNIYYCTNCRGDVSPDRVRHRGEQETPP